jgi:hypothetical protein
MSKESVLTQAEKESIVIHKIIFHVIVQEQYRPIFLDEVVLTDDQKDFFKKRLIDASQGNQFIFTDKSTSTVHSLCNLMIEDDEKNFLPSSKTLTASFKAQHKKSTSDGVFVIVLATILDTYKLVFLIKLDHKLVYEYHLQKGKASLEEIKNTLVEDKKSIQKVALIDISDHHAWDVLAFDRTTPGGITEYFKNYLEVIEKEDATKLTSKVISSARNWASINKENIDPDQEASNYKKRAIDYLISHPIFDSDEFIDCVIFDDDLKRKAVLVESFKNYLVEIGIYGQTFNPSRSVIDKRTKKNVRITSEGLRLEWIGEPNEVNISIPNEPDKNDGLYHIVIKTSEIIEKS